MEGEVVGGYVCACVRERVKERERVCVWEGVCVCVHEKERDGECACQMERQT